MTINSPLTLSLLFILLLLHKSLLFVFYLLTPRKILLTERVKEWSSPTMSNEMHCKILPIISVKILNSICLTAAPSCLQVSPLLSLSVRYFSPPALENFTVRFYWLICIMNEEKNRVILYLVDNTIEDMKLSQLKLDT